MLVFLLSLDSLLISCKFLLFPSSLKGGPCLCLLPVALAERGREGLGPCPALRGGVPAREGHT